ncbi:hypothetical protein A4R26_25930 [Niastella populi]|uniref:Uncharacterized protein n=1 Tax=Niastella populi TaxID=550983 RepID=A0A1V9FD79_9BACT|nr:hypothetical protein A4R26_25930 [Niastella populi]
MRQKRQLSQGWELYFHEAAACCYRLRSACTKHLCRDLLGGAFQGPVRRSTEKDTPSGEFHSDKRNETYGQV